MVNCSYFHLKEYEADALQRRFSGGSHSYGGESPRLSPCGSIGKLSKSDEQLSSLEQDSGQCSRNTSCETLGERLNHYWGSYFETVACQVTHLKSGLNILMAFYLVPLFTQTQQRATTPTMTSCIRTCLASTRSLPYTRGVV